MNSRMTSTVLAGEDGVSLLRKKVIPQLLDNPTLSMALQLYHQHRMEVADPKEFISWMITSGVPVEDMLMYMAIGLDNAKQQRRGATVVNQGLIATPRSGFSTINVPNDLGALEQQIRPYSDTTFESTQFNPHFFVATAQPMRHSEGNTHAFLSSNHSDMFTNNYQIPPFTNTGFTTPFQGSSGLGASQAQISQVPQKHNPTIRGGHVISTPNPFDAHGNPRTDNNISPQVHAQPTIPTKTELARLKRAEFKERRCPNGFWSCEILNPKRESLRWQIREFVPHYKYTHVPHIARVNGALPCEFKDYGCTYTDSGDGGELAKHMFRCHQQESSIAATPAVSHFDDDSDMEDA